MSTALIWPSNKPSYYIYKPLYSSSTHSSASKSGSSLLGRFVNSVQLLYYQYLLHTGLYMLSWREQASINTIVLICLVLSIYWLIGA